MVNNTGNIAQARSTYRIQQWSDGYFDINNKGNVCMQLPGQQTQLDLHQLTTELQNEGLRLPLLIRFVDILHDRVQQLQQVFNQAIAQQGGQSQYTAIFPIKVNQQRSVVENILIGGGEQVGLEAGSKPELLAVLGTAPAGSTIICNGYKDREYLRMALIGRQMGHNIYIVIEKPSELTETLEESAKLGIEPLLGIRVRLYSLGTGKWQNTGGEKSKFGLSATQVLDMLETLKQNNHLHCLQLLHFHMGSQIANIHDIQRGMREASQYFAELCELGAPIKVVDVGGGLGVDYEGSQSRSDCSINYTLQEYANAIIRSIYDICQSKQLPLPDFMSESGRGLTAHHAVLITNVIDTDPAQPETNQLPEKPDQHAPALLVHLYALLQQNTPKTSSEIYHDAVYWLSEAHNMYAYGTINLATRAKAEQLYRAICLKLLDNHELPEHMHSNLQNKLADKYFCNFSLFQSLPDVWAIDQIFPIMPIHRLNERPERRATLQDMTCDSDGTVSQYVNGSTLQQNLPVHSFDKSQAYLLGFFMLGAYQEILGDLHNLFGDTDSINIRLTENGHYQVFEPERGDTIDELLRYVHFEPKDLLAQCRKKLAAKVNDTEQFKALLRELEANLIGYTYLED